MKRVLIFARHTKRWETAHREKLDENGITSADGQGWWVRDDFSTICKVGDEMAVQSLPPHPEAEA